MDRGAPVTRAAVGALAFLVLSCGTTQEPRHPEGHGGPEDRQGASHSEESANGGPLSSGEPQGPAGTEAGMASYYGAKLAGHRTASGERYDPAKLTAAHRSLPFGTLVEVRRADGRAVVVRINDRGPFVRGRVIDLSHAAAEKIGLVHDGTARIELRMVAPSAQIRP